MTSAKTCPVKDDLVNQLMLLNDKLNSLNPNWVRDEEVRNEIQLRRESLYVEIKRHRKNGHDGQRCPGVERFVMTAGR
jgi:hypothetical protein